MRVKAGAAALIVGLCLAGCATPSRFEWGNYEGSLYAYAKRPDLRPQYRQSLEKAIADGRRTNRLAPGLLAELGYLDLEDGNTAEAVKLFQEEIQAFPESRTFLEGVISRASGASPKRTAGAS
jgi:hypothetical protein